MVLAKNRSLERRRNSCWRLFWPLWCFHVPVWKNRTEVQPKPHVLNITEICGWLIYETHSDVCTHSRPLSQPQDTAMVMKCLQLHSSWLMRAVSQDSLSLIAWSSPLAVYHQCIHLMAAFTMGTSAAEISKHPSDLAEFQLLTSGLTIF